jgi:hypothetical protein
VLIKKILKIVELASRLPPAIESKGKYGLQTPLDGITVAPQGTQGVDSSLQESIESVTPSNYN